MFLMRFFLNENLFSSLFLLKNEKKIEIYLVVCLKIQKCKNSFNYLYDNMENFKNVLIRIF